MRNFVLVLLLVAGSASEAGAAEKKVEAKAAGRSAAAGEASKVAKADAKERVTMTEDEWKKKLTPEQYRILRQKGTERAFTGKYWDHHEKGTYRCAGCGQELFEWETKFDSGCGWPSF
ncbi:MAG: peptide-methionine (R)-S-oxide reductase, partial [Myxococcales bacterium]